MFGELVHLVSFYASLVLMMDSNTKVTLNRWTGLEVLIVIF
jgi:hypothetical protein